MSRAFFVLGNGISRHCEERSDEAIQFFAFWIASLRSQ
jgi:hypothetical protein